jgi:hypothetical protein
MSIKDIDFKKYKPSKKTVAIVAAVVAIVFGTQAGVDFQSIVDSANKFAPIINTIIDVFSDPVTNATIGG